MATFGDSLRRPVSTAEQNPDFCEFPISVFSENTLLNLSYHLDPDQVCVANWKSLASEIGMSNNEVLYREREINPTISVLKLWMTRNPVPTIGEFLTMLEKLKRRDVLCICLRYIESDVELHKRMLQNVELHKRMLQNPTTVIRYPESEDYGYEPPSPDGNTNSLQITYSEGTVDDLCTAPQVYDDDLKNDKIKPDAEADESTILEYEFDAFLIFDKKDYEFTKKVINKLESDGFKVCNPYRDEDVGQLKFDSDLELMYNRSRKVIVVLSNEVFDSGMYNWHLNMLVGNDPIAKERKLIPIKYKQTKKNILDHLCSCDWSKVMYEEWFWNKLYQTLKPGIKPNKQVHVENSQQSSVVPSTNTSNNVSIFKKLRRIFRIQ